MSSLSSQPWLPPHVRREEHYGTNLSSGENSPGRPFTPAINGIGEGSLLDNNGTSDDALEDDPRLAAFNDMFKRSEARINDLFGGDRPCCAVEKTEESEAAERGGDDGNDATSRVLEKKPAARVIDEDDYGDYDDEEGEEDAAAADKASPLKIKTIAALPIAPSTPLSSTPMKHALSSQSAVSLSKLSQADANKTSEEVRKKLEEDKKAAEDVAKASFNTIFYTFENDRDAMLEQQKLEELDRQVDAEMSHAGQGVGANLNGQGKLSNVNLGASSLTLKHLIARIDAQREKVRVSDMELRNLMSEVRKNRSRWANEDRVGQEELYEACDKVLTELKAMTEHSTAFLSRVNKREAPDYYNIIKQPMDLGTMTKKLKQINYKSKHEFVNDLNLIWANCLKYNQEPSHYLRKHALSMKKETEKLVPLIPEIVIRDRVEVEAEERRLHGGDGDAGDESDDEPIMSSRGRKAPGKKAKKGAKQGRAAQEDEGTPTPETKPQSHLLGSSGLGTNLKNEFLRADSNPPFEGVNGFSTPPLGGTLTPANGVAMGAGSQADGMDADGFGSSISVLGLNGLGGPNEDLQHEDLEYKTWKAVTKKDRAKVASARHRLFKGDKLNSEEPALLRTRAGMRRFLRHQREHENNGAPAEENKEHGGETLAEGMEDEEEMILPDYYDVLSAVPELPWRLNWTEDIDGNVELHDQYLRVLPKGYFTAPDSSLVKKMHANMAQMQETRKVCSKIGVIKQMQLQSQMYQNQFQKYQPEPFVEADIETHVVSDEGPVMAPIACRAALQRAVAELCYHTGFEETQPSALDAITDIAADYFMKLVMTLGVYSDAPKGTSASADTPLKERFTREEKILHCLHENGTDLEALQTYVSEDVERLGTKLGVMHERMKAHLADLLRPALADAGEDGSNAFRDNSEQFVGGDFAEEIGEDFFGFKELGLDREFGYSSLSVPLHLLQNRMHNAYQAQNTNNATTLTSTLTAPPPLPPLTLESLKQQIGLVQNFFLAKLHANNDEPLVEDEDLPQKQRFPKPRLPPTGKISSPRKRPLAGQGSGSKKKKKVGDTPSKKKDEKKDDGSVKKQPVEIRSPIMERQASKLSEIDGDMAADGVPTPESMGTA